MPLDVNRPIIPPVGKMYRYGAGVEYDGRDDLTIGAGLDLVWEGNVHVKQSGNNIAGTVNGKYKDAFFVFASVYARWKF
jgi:long-subunit fatty acid transport protein